MTTDTVVEKRFAIPAMKDAAVAGPRSDCMPRTRAYVVVDHGGAEVSKRVVVSFPATITKEASDVFVGRVLALPGCVSQGETFDEARSNLADALKSILDFHKLRGTSPAFEPPTDDELPASSDVFPIHVDVAP
jgi:predicted RNase H-like HicB family nuclease